MQDFISSTYYAKVAWNAAVSFPNQVKPNPVSQGFSIWYASGAAQVALTACQKAPLPTRAIVAISIGGGLASLATPHIETAVQAIYISCIAILALKGNTPQRLGIALIACIALCYNHIPEKVRYYSKRYAVMLTFAFQAVHRPTWLQRIIAFAVPAAAHRLLLYVDDYDPFTGIWEKPQFTDAQKEYITKSINKMLLVDKNKLYIACGVKPLPEKKPIFSIPEKIFLWSFQTDSAVISNLEKKAALLKDNDKDQNGNGPAHAESPKSEAQ